MNQRLNSQNLCSSWRVTRWVSLALPLAFSAVIGWSAPARGDAVDVVWETGPFCDGCTTTNIVFVSLAEFDAYTNGLWRLVVTARGWVNAVELRINDAKYEIDTADGLLERSLEQENIPYLTRMDVRGARNHLATSVTQLDEGLEYIETSQNALVAVQNDLVEGVGVTRALVATACESSSNGCCSCDCPDYTTFLQTMIAHLEDIGQNTVDIRALLESIYYWLCDLYADGSGVGIFPSIWTLLDQLAFHTNPDHYDGTDAGYNIAFAQFSKYVANLTTNTWAFSTSLYGPLLQPNPFTRSLDSASDPVAHWALDLGTLWQQLLYDGPANPGGYASGPVAGWRDFALTKNNHPTNTADNPLYVRFNDTDSTSISVSVDGLGEDFYSSLSNLLAGLEYQVVNSLSQPSLHVTVDNTNDFTLVDSPDRLYEHVVNNSTTINNIASEVTGQQAEYDDPDWTLDDYGSLFDKSAEMRDWDFVGKWADMFDDVQIEPPGPCKLWDGFAPNSGNDSGTPGPWAGWSQMIDIQSLYWYPMESCGGLIRSIRGVFRALWTIVILFVIAGLVRINWLLARCGVRILIAVVAAFGSPDPMGAVVDVFETVLKALSQLYTGLFGGRPAESD